MRTESGFCRFPVLERRSRSGNRQSSMVTPTFRRTSARWRLRRKNPAPGARFMLRLFPGRDPCDRVSAGGGTQPMWHPNGKELFFLAPDDGMMSVAVEPGRTFTHEQPRKLFTVQVNQSLGSGNEYAVSKDGSRFLVNVLPSPKHITVVLDWLLSDEAIARCARASSTSRATRRPASTARQDS